MTIVEYVGILTQRIYVAYVEATVGKRFKSNGYSRKVVVIVKIEEIVMAITESTGIVISIVDIVMVIIEYSEKILDIAEYIEIIKS
ncbi:hypothetical protein CEXT_685941 [Caerostris extrusa]|uniref:Uncharacterized protein n=1 Tax=Caerostris extrusa TaxID=172846 RepID=A0AAV4Q3U6_CAEEX|nr:hypothetical protein CEXT_685941 [Caerostris extrusa]